MIVRILLLGSLVSLAKLQDPGDLDSLIENVFGTTTPQNKIDKPREAVDENGDECVCVPYYQCANGKIVTDGTGILDIRIRGICEDYIDQCCKDPTENTIKPEPKQRKGCGQRHPEGIGFRIIGDNNNEAQFGEFPWMVALLRRSLLDDGTELMVYQCGGALIHESVVLTAAHCVTKKNEDSEIIVRAGEWDTQRTNEVFPHQNRKVVRTIVHPGFQGGNLWNDFALLVVEKPFEFAENVDTVCLPSPGVVPLSRECYASGWGKDLFGQKGKYQVILKKIDLPIVTKDQCIDLLRKTRLGKHFRLHESFVCAGGVVGKDTCKGDGGSPLVCPVEGKPGTYEVTGLVAWGIGCGDETPGVYAGVAYARSWIDKTMADIGFPI
ncbi:phenoloxidase-activating factor 2 [Halyomorpha halys]|uniref:phenoloxidase-activating factor 2 n=1 Tax=Halyomorpha halys TaxID=286706 RepID=UPI0006D4D3DA|nr:phenoloxidase-activating factor 2-like [Halyomorpha halys]